MPASTFIQQFARVISTGFGSSLPFARGERRDSGSGTAGTAVGLLLWWFIPQTPTAIWAALLLILPLSLWSIEASKFKYHDDPRIVVDEIAGMWWTIAFLPNTLPVLITGFFLFRLLDIWKPGPIRRSQEWPGGLGVLADDVLAGMLGNLILRLALFAFHALR